jgi:SH3-like domain-containing protein
MKPLSARRRVLGHAALILGLALSGLAPLRAWSEEVRGPVTNLPLPRYVSLKAGEANARRGPSLAHRIDWIFRHRDMPLRVTGEFGNWRRVEDNEGQGGWVHYTLISGVRMVLFEADLTTLRSRPDPEAEEVAEARSGVIGRLGECVPDWCRITAGGERGWVEKKSLWGVDPDELRE